MGFFKTIAWILLVVLIFIIVRHNFHLTCLWDRLLELNFRDMLLCKRF